MSTKRIAGSYRDPSGYVLSREGRIFRAVDGRCGQLLNELMDQGLLPKLIEQRSIVATSFVQNDVLRRTLQAENQGFELFLEHEVLDTITYPYEWSFSMLADAGVHTLDLQIQLLSSGCSLKDATSYNIQFVHGQPIFIDISSIERPKRLDIWFALGQFYQTFLFPLMLCNDCGWDLRSYFLASLGGRQIEEVARSFGWLQRLRPRLLLDLTIPLWLHRCGEKGTRSKRDTLEERRPDISAQLVNLKRLRKKVVGLSARYKLKGIWSKYTQICNYQQTAEDGKKSLIKEFLQTTAPKRILDIGCNTGDYARLGMDCGAQVLAVDSDHDAVEFLYRDLRRNPGPITPMVMDLCNPSPGLGYMNLERESFLERVDVQCVLALALMHHLLVSGNLPLPAIRDMLFELTTRDLVLEFVPTDDNMFQRLIKFRVNLFGDVTLHACRDIFLQRFDLLKEASIPDSKRTLLFLRKVDQDRRVAL